MTAEVFDLSGPEPGVYTAAEAARILKVSPKTVAREVKRGRLRACRVGRVLRITESQLRRYLEGEAP